MWNWVIKTFGWAIVHWGGMSQAIAYLMAFVITLRQKEVAKLEERSPLWKIALPLFVGMIAITGWWVTDANDTGLHVQITSMQAQLNLEATKNDMAVLTQHIDTGFSDVVSAISSLGSKSTTSSNKPIPTPKTGQPKAEELPLPPHITLLSQSRSVSTDAQYKFALRVTIQSDQQVPASFAIECTGEVGDVDAFIVGQGFSIGKMAGKQGDVALVRISYPPITPQSPLVVTILSKDDIRVKGIKPWN